MRRYERHKLDSPVVVRTSDGCGAALNLKGHCVNISEGGAGCIMSARLSPGDFVVIELQLPHLRHAVTVGARVRHSERFFHGFEFVAPAREVVNQLRTA